MEIWISMLSHEKPDGSFQNNHIPLSIGYIANYIQSHLRDSKIKILLFKKPSELSVMIEKYIPNIIMFGNYMWNENLNLFFSQKIRKKSEECLIIFGGPNISNLAAINQKLFDKNKQIDYIIRGDGEKPAAILVDELLNTCNDKSKIREDKLLNCIYLDKDTGRIKYSPSADMRVGNRNVSFREIGSPYLNGLFDKFLTNNSIPLLESNRGCPYQCSYCQQGDSYYSKIRFQDSDIIYNELKYIAAYSLHHNLNISIVEFTDPNFGMYENDSKIFDAIRSVQDKFNFPTEIWCSTGKSHSKRIFENARKLLPNSIMIRAAMQSMNATTLKEIKRKNLPIDEYENFSNSGVETYSDIMLGLPGETKESYIHGLLKLIDSNIDEFSLPQTILLKGTPMENSKYINRHSLQTAERPISDCFGYYGNEETYITEFENVIIKTKTINIRDYLQCRFFGLIIMVYHNTRLLNHVYKYLDSVSTPRSVLIENIYNNCNKSEEIKKIKFQFYKSLLTELKNKKTESVGTDDQSNTNKVFMYTQILLSEYSEYLVAIYIKSLKEIVELNADETKFFTESVKLKFLGKDYELGKPVKCSVPNSLMGKKGANEFEVFSTNHQIERIMSLKQVYKGKKSRVEQMPYILRPNNLVKSIRFF